MIRSLHLALLALAIALGLAACGGGGGSAGTSGGSSSASTEAPTAKIAALPTSVNSGSTVTLDGSASTTASSGLTYQWSLSTKPAGSSAALSNATSAAPTITPDVGGSYTVILTVTNAAGVSASDTLTFTVVKVVDPAIELSASEPLSGSIQLSLSGTVSGSVTWYLDLLLLGSGSSASGSPISWNTASSANGSHSVVARIQIGTGNYQEVRRTVTVSNSTVILSASPSGTTGTIYVDARASSTYGIAAVSAAFDGGAATTLSAPNACSKYCSGANDVYRFTVNATQVGSGSHSMVIVASDNAGASKTLTVAVPVSNAPVLALGSPSDGAFVNGTLRIAGSATSDKPGAVNVTARLGDLQILGTTSSAFSSTYDISGISAKAYTLTLTATDATGQAATLSRTVIITSTPALAYAPVFALPTGASLLAADGTQVLYSTSDGGAYLHDLVLGTEVTLKNAAGIQYATDWQISGGRVYAQAKDSDCTPTFDCIYMWDASGTRTNLSVASPYTSGSSYQENPVARGGYVVWTNWNGPNAGSYTLYEVASSKFTRIAQPATINYVGNTDYDMAVVNGTVHFYYWGQTGGSGTSSSFDVYKWDSGSGASTRLSSGGARNIYPQTDGVRMVWERTPAGGSTDGTVTLLTLPLAGGTATTVATGASENYSLEGGVLVWSESSATSKSIKASSSSGATSVLSALSTGVFYANGEGKVAFGEAGWVYSWDSATGARTLRLETTPGRVFITGGAMIFTVNLSVYRVAL